jgi:hypothetical protein
MIIKHNQQRNENESALAELLYQQAIQNVEALNYEINEIELFGSKKDDRKKLYNLLEMEREAHKQAYTLSQFVNV